MLNGQQASCDDLQATTNNKTIVFSHSGYNNK